MSSNVHQTKGGSTSLTNYYNKQQVDALIASAGGDDDTALLTRVNITVTGDVMAGAGNAIVTPVVGSAVSWVVGGVSCTLTGAQTLTGAIAQADATYDRFDLVVGVNDQTLAVITGTPASTPSVPTAGAGQVAFGAIYIPSQATGGLPVGGGSGGTGITTVGADHGSASIAVEDGDKLYFADINPVNLRASKSGNLIQIRGQLDVTTGKLLGDATGSGSAGDVTVGSGLTLSGGTLTASGGSSVTTLYSEDTAGEWTAAVGGSGSSSYGKAASGAFAGSKCINLNVTSGTAYITLTKPSSGTIDPLTDFDVLSFYIKTDNGTSPGILRAVWQSGGSDVSDIIDIDLSNQKYGFNKTISNWQRISVPRSNWVMTGGTATTLKLYLSAAGGVKIDKVELYSGVAGTFVTPPAPSGLTTQQFVIGLTNNQITDPPLSRTNDPDEKAFVSVRAATSVAERIILKFNETSGSTANDSSGFGNNATLYGSPSLVTGRFLNALSLNGSSQYATINNAAAMDFDAGDFSISCHIKVASAPTGGDVYAIYHRTFSPETTTPFIQFYVATDGCVDGYFRGNGAAGVAVNGTTNVADNTWHFIEVRKSGNQISLRVDGSVDTTVTFPYGLLNHEGAAPLIGCTGDAAGGSRANYFNGLIDDFRVTPRALNNTEATRVQAGSNAVAGNKELSEEDYEFIFESSNTFTIRNTSGSVQTLFLTIYQP